jgi:hypothetical protein
LVLVGNLVGRSPHALVEGTKHHTNLFTVLVGATAKGRKGTSWDRILQVLPESSARWRKERILSGLSSGEGLIAAVQDGKSGEPNEKRLLAFESEFSSVLTNIGREGNVLSAVLRSAWDSGNLQTLTKNSPALASGAHISLVGHITQEELVRCLTRTQAANGFGNRILWVATRRSQLLPDGGTLAPDVVAWIQARLDEVIRHGSGTGLLVRDSLARDLWEEVYEELSSERSGLAGALLSRGEAQVLRLSCIYALLDLASEVRPEHLRAALAVWRYLDASVLYIFDDALGNSVAQKIRVALAAAPEGLTRQAIRDLFARHKGADEIETALAELEGRHLAWCRDETTPGRSAERWFAGTPPAPYAPKASKGGERPSLTAHKTLTAQRPTLTVVPAPNGEGADS